MKFLAIASDFDGTIAQNDKLDETVRKAIAVLRERNIAVILVTGRRLEDLCRLVGDLHFVDAVVSENGAVISFPLTGYKRILGQSPWMNLLEDLSRSGVVYSVGDCVVDAAASDAPQILKTIQKLEVPVSLVFNRSRVMLLPQGISKATGLLKVLEILRLSPHDVIGIGDAENDHELLQACEFGVAVEWGSEVLKRAADFVFARKGSVRRWSVPPRSRCLRSDPHGSHNKA